MASLASLSIVLRNPKPRRKSDRALRDVGASLGSSVLVVQLQVSPFFPTTLPCPASHHIQSSPWLSLSMGPLYMFLDLTLPLHGIHTTVPLTPYGSLHVPEGSQEEGPCHQPPASHAQPPGGGDGAHTTHWNKPSFPPGNGLPQQPRVSHQQSAEAAAYYSSYSSHPRAGLASRLSAWRGGLPSTGKGAGETMPSFRRYKGGE